VLHANSAKNCAGQAAVCESCIQVHNKMLINLPSNDTNALYSSNYATSFRTSCIYIHSNVSSVCIPCEL